MAARWSEAGTVSLSSTLSAFLASSRSSTSCSSVSLLLGHRLSVLVPDYAVDVLLYNSAVSGNCYKVRLLLAHLGIAYETVEMSVVDRSNRAEVLGELNPGLRVPTLVLDDGRPLAESNAILWYFGEGTQYVPGDPYERAQVLQWQFFEQYSHEPNIAVARFWKTYSGKPAKFERQRDRLLAGGYAALDAMERHLDGRDLLRGRALLARGHLALRIHARRARRRLRARSVSRDARLARARGCTAGSRRDRRLAACRSVFASRRARRARSTSATR